MERHDLDEDAAFAYLTRLSSQPSGCPRHGQPGLGRIHGCRVDAVVIG
jgi:hypothetical protein